MKACDKLLTSLAEARENAVYVAGQIEKMEKMTKEKPTVTHHTAEPC